MAAISYEKALEIYLDACTSGKALVDICQENNTSIGIVTSMVHRMRKAGVNVPRLRRKRGSMPVAALKRMVRDFTNT